MAFSLVAVTAATSAAATASKAFTADTLRSAAKQSEGIHLIPLSLRRAIKKFLREREEVHMNRKVLMLSQSFNRIKDANLQMSTAASRSLVDDPLKSLAHRSARWKVQSAYGDIGVRYDKDESVAYVASRMPAVYSACHRVLKEVRRRLPGFSPTRVLDFGAGPGSALWAMRDFLRCSLEQINLVEPSKDMHRAAQSLLQDLKGLPLIHSYDNIQALGQKLEKCDRQHDLVISSYALGEIPSLSDRITIVRQLWDLTQDVLVLLEPGTPQGSKIIRQMRSYILWMAKRKCRKNKNTSSEMNTNAKSITVGTTLESGAFVVAPCSHDGHCPLENTSKYCHFVQRLERTTSQRAYKRSKGESLRGFEDEKFCYVVLRCGKRPCNEAWPLDGMESETLKEQHAKRNPEDLIIDYEDQFVTEGEEESEFEDDLVPYASDVAETNSFHDHDLEAKEEEEVKPRADLGGGWGRIVYSPVRRGKQVTINVCRSTKRDGSEGAFDRMVVTQSRNPSLHHQARRSLWGDLWPC